MDGRNAAPVDRWFIPGLMGLQPSVWWCKISSIHSIFPSIFCAQSVHRHASSINIPAILRQNGSVVLPSNMLESTFQINIKTPEHQNPGIWLIRGLKIRYFPIPIEIVSIFFDGDLGVHHFQRHRSWRVIPSHPHHISFFRCHKITRLSHLTLWSSNMAGWKIPELNGGFMKGTSQINGPLNSPFSSKPFLMKPEGNAHFEAFFFHQLPRIYCTPSLCDER